jgi:hypothetical protein
VLIGRTWRFHRSAGIVRARVVAVATAMATQKSGSSRLYLPTFAWDGPDGPILASVRGGSSAYNFPVGTEIDILVNPGFPGRAAIKGEWPYFFGAIFLAMGMIFAAVGVAALLSI